ncbi:MAG: aminotransferase class I/II-fold pyridoxal phosphate-dependent enzyme [Saprospiraceae bacterium]|nr:aminotransferase class I/II-fold pyridoxal phosphate-dependent enzyme [Saprospiraceae bacterium]MDP4821051.1 aminotransferase class I/II-fold pyridoxal phosphate-dependent enzyme [Saprospiraceae bacterium]MDP4998235.1 aminotransferase class I/II-fold pyridoxal phosphate-dependent enzyme [Saprospiraceae bacterium]
MGQRKNSVRVDLNLNIRGLKKSATLAINEKSRALQQAGKKIYRLGFGQSPFPVPEPVVQALRENAHQKDYLAVKGLLPLREAIAETYKRRQQLSVDPEDVLIGPGSKELLFLLQLVYYGDLVIPTPSWVSYAPQALIVGRRVNWVKTHQENDWRLTPEEIAALCEQDPERPRIVILNYPSNPTGATYTVERLKKIAEVARKYKLILLADEIYGELHHSGQHVSIARFYPEGTIVSSGLSKWCGAGGWRLGFFVFPESLRWLLDAMAVVASETFTSTSAPIQYAAVAAFQQNPMLEDYLSKSRRILKFIGKAIHSQLEAFDVKAPKPQGGFYLFPNFEAYREKLSQRGIHDASQLCDRMLDEIGVALLPSYDFGRPSTELTARLSYVDFDGARALEVLDKEYADKELDQRFLDLCCSDMMNATMLMRDWLTN